VACTANGGVLVGRSAQNQTVTNLDRTVRAVQHRIGTDWSVGIDGKRYTAPEIIARVLQKLERDAETYLGEDLSVFKSESLRPIAPEHAGGLADLDEVAVWVAEIAPDLGFAVDWFGEELCPFGFGVGVERGDVGDPHVQE